MEEWLVLILILVFSSLCSFSISSAITGGLVYASDKAKKDNDLITTLTQQQVNIPGFFQQYLQDSGTVNCQDIANKYNVYPPKSSIYLSGDDYNKWTIAGCNVYPTSSILFSSMYSNFGDQSINFAPYVSKSVEISNLVNASERLELRVEPGPKFCVYKNGVLDRCTQGATAQGNFKLKIGQNGNLCLTDGTQKPWCAITPDLDNSNMCDGTTCPSGQVSTTTLRNANLLTVSQYRDSHRTARLMNGKFCLYPDQSDSSTPLWCNK